MSSSERLQRFGNNFRAYEQHHKVDRVTKWRIRLYELKIRFGDFYDRITTSLHDTLRKSGNDGPKPRQFKENFRSGRMNSVRRKAGRHQPHSDWEAFERSTFERSSKRRKPLKYSSHKEDGLDSSRTQYTGKKRSSLTRRKGCMRQNPSLGSTSMKSLGSGDNASESTTSTSRRKKEKTRTENTNAKQSLKTKRRGKRKDASLESAPVTASEGETQKLEPLGHDEIKKEEDTKNREPRGTADISPSPPPQHFANNSTCVAPSVTPAELPTESKGFFRELFESFFAPRKRKQDYDAMPPKIVKFGIKLSTPAERYEREGKTILKKVHGLLDQMDGEDELENPGWTQPADNTTAFTPLSPRIIQPGSPTVGAAGLNAAQTFSSTRPPQGSAGHSALFSSSTVTRLPLRDTQVTSGENFRSYFRKIRNTESSSPTSAPAPHHFPSTTAGTQSSVKSPSLSGGVSSSPFPGSFATTPTASPPPKPAALQTDSSNGDLKGGPVPKQETEESVLKSRIINSSIYNPQTPFTSKFSHLLLSN